MTEPISNALSLCKSDSSGKCWHDSDDDWHDSDDESAYDSQDESSDPLDLTRNVRYFFTKTPTNFLPKGESGKIKKILCRAKPTGED